MEYEARSLAESEGSGGDEVGIQMEDIKCSFRRVRDILGLPRSTEL